MTVTEAVLMGLVQGITEFLPISSDGHLELAKVLLKLKDTENLSFIVAVHGATVLSACVVFFHDIARLLKGFFQFRWNEEMQYALKIGVSMIPVLIAGLFFKDAIEQFFTGNMLLTSFGFLMSGIFLTAASVVRQGNKDISYLHSFVIGIAQALAVLPGLSRSGSTISTGLLLGNRKEELARFSFLMALIPILGANLLDFISSHSGTTTNTSSDFLPLLAGFVTAFVTGLLACRWMISLVKKGKLLWFGIYCFAAAILLLILHFTC